MPEAMCGCGHFMIDTETAAYTRAGAPLCNENTCQKAREHEARNLRRVGHFDDIEHDRLPNEVQGNFRFDV